MINRTVSTFRLMYIRSLFFMLCAVLSSSSVCAAEPVLSLAFGAGYTMIVMADGSLWGWGNNAHGELGDGTTINRQQPVFIANGYKQIVAAGASSLGVKSDGTLWMWGQEDDRGDNSALAIHTRPVLLISNISMVAMGTWENIAVDNDGALFGWGGWQADCGLAPSVEDLSQNRQFFAPTKLNTGPGYKYVTVGTNYTIGLKSDGTIWSWGVNANGELGRSDQSAGDNPFECFPVRKIGDGFISVSTQTFMGGATLAIKEDSSLWGWGDGGFYELMDARSPLRKPKLLGKGYAKIVFGGLRVFAVKTDGTLWAWGENQTGYLGDGTRKTRSHPVKIGDDYVDVYAGYASAVAIKKDGSIWTWGENEKGELGDGTAVNRLTPIKIMIK